MATLLTAPELPSSDDEDTDFLPGQEPAAQPRSKKRKASEAELGNGTAAAVHKHTHGDHVTSPDARAVARSEKQVAKVDAVWQALSAANRPSAGSSKSVSQPGQPLPPSAGSAGAGFSLASLCVPMQKPKAAGQRQVRSSACRSGH